MPIGPRHRLSLLSFPQSWDGQSMVVRFLCLPKGDPLQPLDLGGLPTFAEANLVFEAKLIGSLDRLPLPADAVSTGPLLVDEPPTQKLDLFSELTRHFTIAPRVAVPRAPVRFRKAITESYRALIGDRRRSELLLDRNDLDCAMHEGAQDQIVDPPPPSDQVSWGRLIAFALRQPRLAGALGLLGQVTVTPADPGFFAAGGWLYIDLHASSDYAAADGVARYAGRIPKLVEPRSIFAAVLFPVLDAPADFVADDVSREAERYDDGLAKLVHGSQSAAGAGDSGDSIQLAWEDEQIAEWFQRQVQLTPAGELVIDAPNGVSGYRVDVRRAGEADWNSLTRIESLGDLQLGPLSLGVFQGEGVVEVAPAQLSPKQDGAFWLPSYFTTWRGSSLVLTDSDLTDLHARPEVQNADAPAHLLDREKIFKPVADKAVPLRYGETYEFRVRLSDLTRGGPDVSVPVPVSERSSIARIAFQRRKAPAQIQILERPAPESMQVRIGKPRLGHPEALFTGEATFADLEQDLARLAADPTITREISVPDPDVLTVEIRVEVKALDGDVSRYLPLYLTTRVFDAAEMTLALDFQDHANLVTLAENQPADGPLALPTARDLRLTFVAVGRDQPGYFADEKARRGAPVTLDVRRGATIEGDLIGEPAALSSLRSFFFQPLPPDNSVASPSERLAAELGLDHLALTLSGRSGKRTVVACSAELRHVLSPESSAITFASAADLVQRWINVATFEVLRDWTWDGLDGDGLTVTRVVHAAGAPDVVETVGAFRLPRVVGRKAVASVPADPRAPARQSTDLIFFDAFDPKPKAPPKGAGEAEAPRPFPAEVTVDYVLEPALKGLGPGPAVSRSILLPITTPPSQTPRIVSAGIALSEYKAAADYSSTDPRRRVLWLEFAETPADPDDAYYVRVLAKAPDPMLLPDDTNVPEVVETPLPIDPEWMRLITPGQPRDESGLSAMQQIEDSPDRGSRYLIPLPPELELTSADLFGFFVYEVRVGHTARRWSTARGRFGPMLRIAGVQHPAPPLVCQAARSKMDVLVQAPFATPVLNGANLRPMVPKTDLWALLYARVRQADGSAWRNVLLAQTQLFAPHQGNDPEHADLPILYGEGVFAARVVEVSLARLGLPPDEPLTVLAAEIFGDPSEADPLGGRTGQARILRISPLVPVPAAC